MNLDARFICAVLVLTLSIPSMCDITIKKEGTVVPDNERVEETVNKNSAKNGRLEDFTTTGQEAEKLKARWSGKVFARIDVKFNLPQ